MKSQDLLNDLFGPEYVDLAKEVYEGYLTKLSSEGIELGIMIGREIRSLPPETLLPIDALLPIKTYSRIVTSRYVEQGLKAIGVSWREFLGDHFVLCEDDEITFEVNFRGSKLVDFQGLVKDVQVPLKDILAERMGSMDILTVKIKLVSSQEMRTVREKISHLDDSANYHTYLTSSALQIKLIKKLPLNKQIERLLLYGKKVESEAEVQECLKTLQGLDFGLLDLTELGYRVSLISKPTLSNEEILNSSADKVKQGLINMQNWLLKGTELE